MSTIKDQITFYHKNSSGMTGDQLQDLFDRLSANLYFYLEEFAKAQKSYLQAYWDYRKARSTLWLKTKHWTTEKVTDRQAEAEVDNQTTTEFANRLFAEADLDLKKEEINAVKMVLRAIESRLDGIKTERIYSYKKQS